MPSGELNLNPHATYSQLTSTCLWLSVVSNNTATVYSKCAMWKWLIDLCLNYMYLTNLSIFIQMKLSGLSFFIVIHFLRCSMRCCFGAIYCIVLNCRVLILLLMAHQQMIPWFCRPKVLVIYEKWSPFWMNLFWQLRRLTILWVLNAYDHKFFNKGYILEINKYCVEIWSSNTWVDHFCSLVTHQCFSWVNDSGPQP